MNYYISQIGETRICRATLRRRDRIEGEGAVARGINLIVERYHLNMRTEADTLKGRGRNDKYGKNLFSIICLTI